MADIIFRNYESNVQIFFNGIPFSLYETSIQLMEPSIEGPLVFNVCSGAVKVVFKLAFDEGREGKNYSYLPLTKTTVEIKKGSVTKNICQVV